MPRRIVYDPREYVEPLWRGLSDGFGIELQARNTLAGRGIAKGIYAVLGADSTFRVGPLKN